MNKFAQTTLLLPNHTNVKWRHVKAVKWEVYEGNGFPKLV